MAERVRFWLLDINYEDTPQGPEVYLWGIDKQGRRVVVVDREFLPYFYAVVSGEADPGEVLRRVEAASKPYGLVKCELVDRRLFGKPVKAVRVVLRNSENLEKCAEDVGKLEGVSECLEDDIRLSVRYLIDNGVNPCDWNEVEASERSVGELRVDALYTAKGKAQPVEEELPPPDLRVMALYMVARASAGSPKAERDPVVVLSTLNSEGELKTFTADGLSDKELLESFVEYVLRYDPDVIVGYGSNKVLWPYLMKRCELNGVKLSVGRTGAEPHTSLYGHVSITGRANVDLFDFVRDIPDIKLKTLESAAEFFGIPRPEEELGVEEYEVPRLWDSEEGRGRVVRFAEERVRMVMALSDSLLDFAVQLSRVVGMPLDYVGTAAVGFKVENFLMRQAYRFGELVPKRVERPYMPYVGALVLKPKPGVHEDIAVLDFSSMYPSLMIKYNISPDTLVPEGEEAEEVYTAPEVGHRFRKEPPGFYRRVLSELLKVRSEIRERIKKLDKSSRLYRVLDARQRAVKTITNACYGYAGWTGARWYIRPVAEATTAWGRATIRETIKTASELGLEIVYGDTDSVFVKYDPEKVEEFLKTVEERIGLRIKPDKIYKRVLFTEAKKRYAGILEDGRIDIVGLEVARGDWAEIAKRVQRDVIEIILREGDVRKAVSRVREYIAKVKSGKVPLKDLVIWKTLTKELDEYKVRAPHVEAAKRLLEAGWELTLGDKVGYVIVKGPGRLYEKAKPYVMASPDEVDTDYYVKKQVIPAAMRVLKVFGVRERDLTSTTLFSYSM